MAKTVRAFYGHDSYGKSVEVAQSVSGNWFFRLYQFNGYGMGWGKWTRLAESEISWSTTIVNPYSGEESPRDEPALEWGWNIMHEIEDTPRYRLPN